MNTQPPTLDDVVGKLQEIDKKVEKIDGKLSQKWVLPVCLAAWGALLTGGNFLVERYYKNKDLSQNKENEVVAEFLANTKVTFYTNCLSQLTLLNEQFESYCKFDQAKQTENQIDSIHLAFRKLILNQQVIDQQVIAPIKSYTDFIAERVFDISTGKHSKEQIQAYFSNSEPLLFEAREMLAKSIQKTKTP